MRTQMSCHYQYCMLGVMNNALSNGNHAVAVAISLPWVWHVHDTWFDGTAITINLCILLLCVLLYYVISFSVGMCYCFPSLSVLCCMMAGAINNVLSKGNLSLHSLFTSTCRPRIDCFRWFLPSIQYLFGLDLGGSGTTITVVFGLFPLSV